MSIGKIRNTIIDQGVLPLYYHKDQIVSLDVLKAIYDSGIRAIEYTNRGDAALNNFRAMVEVKNIKYNDLYLGVGTIKNLDQAKIYRDAGADFIVSPGFVPEVAKFALQNSLFYAPGCMTPSEIITAENAGISFIKLFPGNLLGPSFLSSVKEIFPDLYFMPTGGVDPTYDSIKSWFDAGVCAVGMGSKLITKSVVEAGDFHLLTLATTDVLNIIAKVRTAT